MAKKFSWLKRKSNSIRLPQAPEDRKSFVLSVALDKRELRYLYRLMLQDMSTKSEAKLTYDERLSLRLSIRKAVYMLDSAGREADL